MRTYHQTGDLHNALNRIGNNLAAGKREVHTSWFMAIPSHTPMVVASKGVPPAMRTPCFNSISDLIQVIMAGNDVVSRRDNGDEWALDLLIGQTVSLQKASVRGTRKAFLDRVASHLITPLSLLALKFIKRVSENPGIKKSCAADCIRTTKREGKHFSTDRLRGHRFSY